MVTLPPWLVGVVIVYVIALTSIFSYLFMEQVQRKRRKARRLVDDPTDVWYGRPYAPGAEPGDAEIVAEAPELADAEAAAARTVSLTDAAMDGTLVLVAADRQAEPLVDRIRVERLLIEIDRCVECYRHGQDITAGAPKEWTP